MDFNILLFFALVSSKRAKRINILYKFDARVQLEVVVRIGYGSQITQLSAVTGIRVL